MLLLVPAHVVLRVTGGTADSVQLALSWRVLMLRGTLRRRLTLPGEAGRPPSPPVIAAPTSPPDSGPAALERVGIDRRDPRATPHSPPRAHRRRRGRPVAARVAQLERTVDLARALLAHRVLRVTRLDGWVEFALQDVGDTGRAFGVACALAAVLDPRGHVELRPRWDGEEQLAADVLLAVRVHPLRTLFVLLVHRLRGAHLAPAAAVQGATGAA